MKNIYLAFLFILFFSQSTVAQNFTYSSFEVESATFSGDNLPIRKDDGTGSYGIPQWLSGAEIQLPVAYVSGSAPQVSATFRFACENAPETISVRGVTPDGMTFPLQEVSLTEEGDGEYVFTYPATAADTEFEAMQTRFFDEFKIGWDISFDEGETWRIVDTTVNTLYVTRSAPQAEVGHFKWYHSVYDISCRNADLKSTDTDIIAAVWSEFTDQVVLNENGDSLFYYKPKSTFNTNLGALLKFRNAQCYTFAQLFLSTIKIQGVVRTNNYVYITPQYSTACGYSVNRFLVKNWTFGPATGTGCDAFPYENTYTSLIPYPYTDYGFITADVTDAGGIPGQCSPDPSSYFNNHQISKIDGVYYDACYGVTFESLEDIPFEAFDGWGYRFTIDGVTYARFSNDMEITELSESISTF
jgi:hypothetical protein